MSLPLGRRRGAGCRPATTCGPAGRMLVTQSKTGGHEDDDGCHRQDGAGPPETEPGRAERATDRFALAAHGKPA
jgi:hypothetical protein